MGNEESQQMGMAPGGAGGAAGGAGYAGHPGYPQSNDPRHFSSQGTFRNPQQQNNSPFNFPPPGNNSAASFPGMRQVSPFNSTTPQPQRFSGPSGAGPRFSAPFSGTGPPGYKPPTARMDVDLTGLSAEEQRKIAEVMERAQALQDIESNPTSVFGSRPPAVKPFNQGSSGNLDPSKTSSAFGKSPFAPIPLKEQNISPTVTQKPTMHMQQQSSSTFSPVSAKPTVLNTQTQNWSPPLSSAQFSDSNVAPNSRHKQLLTEQERSLSRSFSSEEQLFSPDNHEPEKNRPPPALPDKWQEEPHQTGSAPPNTIIPANATFPRHPGTAAAKVERCPLCRETELKIVTVHGKAQPLIGQLCARCSLIVCSKCGKVKKSFDQKNAYWMCTQCVNIPWTPPKELDKADFGDSLSAAMKRHDNSFVAPLTHLVAADNSIQSDAVRSSPALFFDDEPSYANARSALLSTTNEPPQYDHHYNDDDEEEEEEAGWEKRFVPETAYQSTGSKTVKSPGKMLPIFQPLPDAVSSLKQSTIVETTSEQSESFADEYNRAHPQEASSSPFPGGENRRSSEQKQQKQEQQFYDELEDRPQAPPLQQPQQLHHHPQWQLIHEELPSHSNSSSDLFPPQMPTFSASQESLYEIQEEETSDYGSQIQAACSDIASLSNSTSGGDFGGGGGQQQRNWLPQAASHNSWAQSESPHHHSGQINANASQLQDNGASLRRSNLVENFRSMPQPSDGASGDASGQQQRHQLNVSSNNKPPAGDSTPRGSSQPNVQLYQPQKGQLSGHVQPEQRHFSTFHGAKQSVLQKTGQEASGSVRAQVERLEQFGISEHQQSGQTMQQSERRRSLPGDKTMERQQESSQQPQRSPSNSNAATGSGQHHAHPPMRETTLLHEPSQQPHPHPQQQPQSGTPRYHPSANSSSSSHEVQQLSNPNFSGDDRKPLHPHQQQQQPVESSSSASTSGLRRIIHQGSRDDLPRVNRPGAHGPSVDTVAAVAEIDDCDSALESSATDGNAADFDTISQCSGNSAALFPPESAGSMRTVHGDGTQSMERRQKRRLPCLPKDDQDGASITPEERERQKKELKRRLSGNLLRLTTTTTGTATDAEPPSVDGVLRNGGGGGGGGGGDGVVSGGRDWQGEATAGGPGKGPASKVVKRKKHKHLPQTPHDHDAPKVQQLKQQLRMLAARKAGGLFEDDKSFGSLPNNPLNRFKSISGDEASSSTEYLTDSTFKSKPQAQAQAQAAATSGAGQARSHYASDPALFRSILDQYHRVAEQEKRERELAEGDRRNGDLQNGDRQNGYLFGSSQSVQLQTHSDPEIQDIVARLQQFNRDLADTKELFRSTSNSLERRHVPRWKSDADLANRRWRRQSDKGQRSRPQHPDDPYFLREMNGYASLPYGNDGGRDKRFQADLQQRIGRNGMWRNEENFEESFHGRRLAQKMGNRFQPEFDEMYNGQQFYDGGLGPREMTFDQQGYPMFDGQNGFNDMDGEFGYADPWCNSLPQTILPDPTFLLPLPYLEATQYPGFNPMTDIDNEDLSLYEPFDDPNFLPMGAGVVLAHHLNQQQQLQQKQSSLANGVTSRRHYAPSVHPADFGGGGSQSPRGQMTSALDAPLFDSRVSCSDEPGKVADLNGHFEDEKENFSDTGSDGLNANEKLSRSVSAMSKKHKKEDLRPKYNFATKRILLTRDPKDRSVSGNGLGVRIAGGKLIPNTNTLGAFVSKIWDNGIMATLNEVKEGDQVLEWNGIPLTNKSYEEVQEILDAGNGEVDMLLRCDYNVRHLEAELEETRDRQLSAAQAERARLRDLDSGDRSPLPTRSLFSGRKQDQAKQDDTDEVVYRPSNQLAPPSPGGMPRKKSTSSGHTPVTGDLLLRMTYERCTLTLQVLKARSLKAADKSGFSDPYCKLNLVPARANEYKFRTKCITQTLNPEWKETFSFQSIDPNEIHHKSIEITVWDWDRLSADDFLGEVIVDLTDPIHLDGTKRWYPLGERRPGAVDE